MLSKYARLSAHEFDAHIANGTCRISFIGMANGGKSFRSKTLARDSNFIHYSVDSQIQEALGLRNMEKMAAWLGYPSTEGYSEREARYLELEGQFSKKAAMTTRGQNLVFDTTGSIVHLDKKVLDALSEHTLVVNIDVGEDSLLSLIERFFTEPKPIAWAEFFTMLPGETEEAAIRRSYPRLLSERLARYRALAHVNIPVKELYDKSGDETLEIIRSYL